MSEHDTNGIPPSLASLRLTPVDRDDRVKLGSKAARVDDLPPRDEIDAATQALLTRLYELQEVFHADRRFALLLVLQGRDASGKDGVIKTVYGAFNPTGVTVAAFGPPTALELRHDFLWRVHQVVPPRGMIGVFNRSHYEDVLAVRVRQLAPESVWRPRFAQINAFEKMLADNGVIIRKCMLHVSREEQFERLRARLDDPRKNWKFRLEDLDDRALWDDYTDAYREALKECSTRKAPWFVVPSDNKSVRNFLIARMLVETLESLDLQFPEMDPAVRAKAEGFE
ncbi:MAG: polyphosphate kinase 2 family protein [Gemmatimonadaceae bacterium]|nr:polyphosphate kinase 2 family protein [Gemmatimonadaceae bacterium]